MFCRFHSAQWNQSGAIHTKLKEDNKLKEQSNKLNEEHNKWRERHKKLQKEQEGASEQTVQRMREDN
jgi:hypothetical protein